MGLVFNPTIEVVTFRLHGRCVLGVFLLPAFTRLEHESESFQSVLSNACVHRLALDLYSHPKEFGGNGVRTHVKSKGKVPSTRGSEEDQTRAAASHRTERLTDYQLSYSGP